MISNSTQVPIVNNDNDADHLAQTQSIALVFIYAAAVSAVGWCTVAYIYHACIIKDKARGCDAPSYHIIFRFVGSIADFWTDVLFAIVLYFERIQVLFILGVCFIVLPFISQFLSAFIWINKWKHWKKDHPKRLHLYLEKYEFALYILGMIAGFYNTIDLVRSKLFYFKMFGFQLKKNESEVLKKYRFIIITIIENVPQLIIQMLYIFNVFEINSQENINIVAFFSMSFSILSILLAVINEISRRIQLCDAKQHHTLIKQFGTSCCVKGRLTFESSSLNYFHNFSHSRIETAMESILSQLCVQDNDNNSINEWMNRSDVIYEINVYYIKDCNYNYNYINTDMDNYNSKLEVFFEINFETFHASDDSKIVHNFLQSIEMMTLLINDETNNINNGAKSIFQATMRLKQIKKIVLSQTKVYNYNKQLQSRGNSRKQSLSNRIQNTSNLHTPNMNAYSFEGELIDALANSAAQIERGRASTMDLFRMATANQSINSINSINNIPPNDDINTEIGDRKTNTNDSNNNNINNINNNNNNNSVKGNEVEMDGTTANITNLTTMTMPQQLIVINVRNPISRATFSQTSTMLTNTIVVGGGETRNNLYDDKNDDNDNTNVPDDTPGVVSSGRPSVDTINIVNVNHDMGNKEPSGGEESSMMANLGSPRSPTTVQIVANTNTNGNGNDSNVIAIQQAAGQDISHFIIQQIRSRISTTITATSVDIDSTRNHLFDHIHDDGDDNDNDNDKLNAEAEKRGEATSVIKEEAIDVQQEDFVE